MKAGSASRAGKFIAVANMKGGVGKTTTVVALADGLAAEDLDKSVLVIDLDPQASASVCIAGDADLRRLIDEDRTVESYLEATLIRHEKPSLAELVRRRISSVTHQGEQLDVSLLPCGPELRTVERELLYNLTAGGMSMNAIDGKIWQLFSKEVAQLRKQFDYIIFDCAPGISPVTEAAIRMADLVVVPTIPDHLSVYGLNAFHGSLWVQKPKTALSKPRSRPHILVSRLQNTRQHNDVMRDLVSRIQEGGSDYALIEVQVPQSAALAEAMTKAGALTMAQKYTSPLIAQMIMPLVHEIKGLLNGSHD